jgi:heme-degrading monooxygenase HmoA
MLYLDVKPGMREALIEWYREVGSLEKAVEYVGCVSTEIYPVPDQDNRLLVTALWRDRQDYQRWVDHPFRRGLTGGINQFLDDDFTTESRGALLESIISAPN